MAWTDRENVNVIENGRGLGHRGTPDATALLEAWRHGDEAALDQLLRSCTRTRRLARRFIGREHLAPTLRPTALVNEAYLRLIDVKRLRWQSRPHFPAMSRA